MIVYISTERNSQLLETEDVFSKTYIKWQYDVGNFVKEEYANILSIHPDAIVIDYMAFKNANKLALMRNAFPDVKHILVVEEEAARMLVPMEGFDIILLNHDAKDKILKIIYPDKITDHDLKEIKIGIIGEETGAETEAAFNLLEFLSKYTTDVCYIEVAEKSGIAKYEKKLKLEKKNGFYEYKGMPILFNVAKSGVKISVFTFDAGNRRMFEKCDYPLELKAGTLIYKNTSYEYPNFKDPVKEDRTEVYRKIFRNELGFDIKKNSEGTIAIQDNKLKNSVDLSQYRIRVLIKAGILILVLLIMFLAFFMFRSKQSHVNREMTTGETITSESEITIMQNILTTEEEATTAPEQTTVKKKTTKKKKVKKEATSQREKATTNKVTEIYTNNTATSNWYRVQTTTKQQNNHSGTEKKTQKKETATKEVTTKNKGSKKETTTKEKSVSTTKEVTTTQPFDFEYNID